MSFRKSDGHAVMTTDTQGRYFFFGDFRLDCRSGELHRKGREIRLQPQPAKLLVLLATHRGEIVSREEIQKALWGDDTFVDFEHGINFSIKQIREALGDSAEKPRYVETVPRVGYRFIALAESEVAPPNLPPPRRWKSRAIMLGAPAAIIVVGVLAFSALRSKSPSADFRMPRFQLSLPGGVHIPPVTSETVVAISPDGSKMAFMGCSGDGLCRLYLRDQSDIDARPIPGTDGAGCPFFSPDGRWIAFGANGKLKKVDLDHGAVVFLADAPQFRGGSWGQDGTILFSRGLGGILRVSAEGGEVQEVTKPDPERQEHDHRWPHVLPGGRAALFDVLYDHANNSVGSRGHDIALVNLETGTKRILVESAGCPKYTSGHLLFGRNGVVYAGPFDIERLELLGAPVAVLEDVAMWSSPGTRANSSGNVQYDFAREETLLFSPRAARLPKRTLVLVDREGRSETVSGSQQAYSEPRLSPDGSRIAVTVETDGVGGSFVVDIASDAWTRVEGDDLLPDAWMPDGRRLLLRGLWSGHNALLLASIDGSAPPETLYVGKSGLPTVAPDGSAILFGVEVGPSEWDLWRLTLTGRGGAEPWLATTNTEGETSFSPDGRWVAYVSDDSGRDEVYVRPYLGAAGRRQITTQGGSVPRWSRDGKEIFFESNGSLWSAPVFVAETFSSRAPKELFELAPEILVGRGFYDVSPDGQHFVMIEKDPFELRPLDLVIIPGWIEEMKARLVAAQ